MKNFKDKVGAVLQGEKTSSAMLSAVLIAVVLVANVVLYTLSSYFGWQLSSRQEADLSISDNLGGVLADAEVAGEKITIIFCYPEKTVREHSTGGYVYQTAKEFEAKYPGVVELKFVNVLTGTDQDGKFVDIDKLVNRAKGDSEADLQILRSSVMFVAGDYTSGENFRVKILTDTSTSAGYSDFYVIDYSEEEPYALAYNGEEVMAAMMCWVLTEEHGTAYFTSGHSEQIDPSFINLLTFAGYNIGSIDLKTAEIPEDASLLVISNPRTDFEKSYAGSGARSETDRIEDYLEDGGDLYVSLYPNARGLSVLEGILEKYGIAISSTENEKAGVASNIVKDSANAITPDGYTLVAEYPDNEKGNQIKEILDKYTDGRVILREAAALQLTGNAKPLLVSSGASELVSHGVTVSTDGSYAIAAYSETSSEGGGSIVVIPSIYLTTTAALTTNGYCNRDFVYSVFETVYGVELLPYGSSIASFNAPILEGLTMSAAGIYTALLMSVPALIAVAGAVILIKRKNR